MNNDLSKSSGTGGFFNSSIAIVIAFFSLVMAFAYNELNLVAIKTSQASPHILEPKYDWIKTADDASYLRPAENYYYHAVWKDNNAGRQSYFLRTPGYGLFRYTLMCLMGFERSYHLFKYVQVLLFGISVLLLYYIAIFIGLPHRYALIAEAIYGLTPFASGFLYYSLTEGITPALMIGFTFFLLFAYRYHRFSAFILAVLIMAYIGLTRPVLLLFGAALPVAVWWTLAGFSFRKKILAVILTAVIALSPISIWALRNATIAGQYVGVYPIYYPENNSQYRPTHAAIWEFEKAYGTEGVDFHKTMVPLWIATCKGDTADIYIDNIISAYPDFVRQNIGENRLRNSFIQYRQSITYQCSVYPQHSAMPDTIPAIEKQVISEFAGYTSQINSSHWFCCHVVVPVKLFKTISFHSNLSLYMFQHTYRGLWWMEAMRYFFLILHFICCLSFMAVVFLAKDKLVRVLFGILIAAYFFFLCYIFRGLEERYTLPILPLMLLGLMYCINIISEYIGKKMQKA